MIDGHKVWQSFSSIIEEIFDIHVVISEDNENVFLHPWYPMRSTDKFLRKNIYKSVFLSTAQSLRIQMYCSLTPSTSFISDYMRVVMVWQNVCLYRQLHHFNASDSWCACLQSQAYLDHRAPILWHLFHTLSWWSLWRYAAVTMNLVVYQEGQHSEHSEAPSDEECCQSSDAWTQEIPGMQCLNTLPHHNTQQHWLHQNKQTGGPEWGWQQQCWAGEWGRIV